MKIKPRSAVLIVKHGQLLLIKRTKTGQPAYYVLPGGGIEAGESPEQAGIRELREELGVDITVENVVKDEQTLERDTWIVTASLKDGSEPNWQEKHKQTPDNRYEVVWIPVLRLAEIQIFPVGVTGLV